jgi:hypothetical protein
VLSCLIRTYRAGLVKQSRLLRTFGLLGEKGLRIDREAADFCDNSLKNLQFRHNTDLDFVAPNLDFLASGLDFNAPDLGFVAPHFEFVALGADALSHARPIPHRARIASSRSATMLVILIAGLTAGPAVSL